MNNKYYGTDLRARSHSPVDICMDGHTSTIMSKAFKAHKRDCPLRYRLRRPSCSPWTEVLWRRQRRRIACRTIQAWYLCLSPRRMLRLLEKPIPMVWGLDSGCRLEATSWSTGLVVMAGGDVARVVVEGGKGGEPERCESGV